MADGQLTLWTERDLDALPRYSEYFSLVVSTAAIHHHAYLEPVLTGTANALAQGGFFVIADWHNSLSTHPAFILNLLSQLQWPDKHSDIELFERTYPVARQVQPELKSEQRQANMQIMQFWAAYARYQKSRTEQFFVLEGHRPVMHYINSLNHAGLTIPKCMPYSDSPNPLFLLPDSELLTVLVAHKPIIAKQQISAITKLEK